MIIFLLLFLIGVVLIVKGYFQSQNICPQNKIEYRFIPRDLQDIYTEPQLPSVVFSDMFKQPSMQIHNMTELKEQTMNTEENNNLFYTAVV